MFTQRSSQLSMCQADVEYLDRVGRDGFYGQAALARSRLFRDQDFAALYCPDNGRPAVAPSLLAVALLLQTHDKVSDEEAISRANDDASLLRWGYHQRLTAPDQPTLEDVAVMTNHNALARQFTVSDNFYMEPEASGVGHRWLVGVQPNNFCQMTYTLGWGFSAASTANLVVC